MECRKILKGALYALLMCGVLALGKLLFEGIGQVTESEYSASMAMNFGSIFVASGLIGALIFDRHYNAYNRVCALVLFTMVLTFALDSLGLYSWKVEGQGRATFIYLNLEYYFMSTALFAMVVALKAFVDPDRRKYHRLLVVAYLPVVFQSALLTQNIFTHNLWYMDGTELIHGPLYSLMYAAPVFQNILYIFASIYLARDKKLGARYALFMLCSAISVLVMYPNYNSTVNYMAALFPMMLVIPYEYNRRGKEIREGNKDIKERRNAMSVAQINIREVESTLIQIEHSSSIPDTVSEALGKFRKFISENYDSFNNPSMVPLDKELEYTKAYLYLEKLRFKGRLEVEYHINSTAFSLPSLSMQVLVENAVKHGISKRPEGGKVTISVDAFKDCYMIVVEDNGVGFDVNAPRNTNRSHVGVDNISQRLREMAGGQLIIESTVGSGTTSTVIIPKPVSKSQN